jgi:hypothetical protein
MMAIVRMSEIRLRQRRLRNQGGGAGGTCQVMRDAQHQFHSVFVKALARTPCHRQIRRGSDATMRAQRPCCGKSTREPPRHEHTYKY